MNEDARKSRPPSHHKKLLLNVKKAKEPERNAKQNHIVEVRSLLSELVNTTAAVLTSGPVHVWQVYGGFQRIYEAVLHIFYHGCVHRDAQGNPDIWPFIIGLRVLSPVLGPSSDVATKPRPGDRWIHSSLQKLQLAAKITALTNEREHLEKHYHPWALFRSLPHVNAVRTCLKALEENSQDGLADIDPKLLVGEYCPPPGSSVINRPEVGDNMSMLKGNLYAPGLSDIAIVDSPVPPYRSVASLPTSPVTEKDWIPDWPQGKPSNPGKRLPQGQGTGAGSNTKEIRTNVIKCHSHPLVRRGKSEVALKSSSKDIVRQSTRPFGVVDVAEQNPALMRRESPDGSSGSTEWPLTSPVSQPIPFITKESPHVSSTSSSPIARLVQGEIVSACKTGARPKEYRSTSQSRGHTVSHFHLDVSDSSEPGSSISPSLLQVNYGGKHSTSEGDLSSSQGAGRIGGGGIEIRTPQLRRRASSGRLGSLHAESDQDSEETVDGKVSQGSRRRRRNTTSQHRSGLSVKMLVDCRGVLGSEINKSTGTVKNLTDSQSSGCKEGELNVEKQTQISSVSTFASSKSENSASHTQSASVNISKPTEVGSTSTGATLGVEMAGTLAGILASSAPGTMMKPSGMPSEISYSSVIPKMKKKTHSRSRSDGSQELAGKLKLATSNTAPTLETCAKLGDDLSYASHIRKRFMDDGGHSITPAADYGVSPRPLPGQSLINFLSSKDKPHAELDRENAHFNISEAVIAALTQMQFNNWLGKTDPISGAGEESDEEIRILEARIREKRRLKQNASGTGNSGSTSKSCSEPCVLIRSPSIKVESTTDYSMYESPQSSAYNSESDPLSELEEEEEQEGTPRVAPVSVSRKTSNADQPMTSDLTSAESVAINLLKQFSEQKLPKASELEWLVSEQDVPQKLLPLPTSVAVSPDDGGMDKESELQMQLRGTMDWAPPRPQLILSLHTNTKRSLLMGMQRWRCAGCGMRVSESLSRHFRLCHYLGRYFCTTCHKNQTAIIPAKILHKWDFKLYPVASFSYELIERMKIDPLINVGALNPRLYKKCRHLHQTHIYRLQLYHTLPYINTCRRAQGEKMTLGKLPLHWASDPHVYSLEDLEAIKAGQVVGSIKEVALLCIRHISKCEVCLGRGFICEICCRGEAIFPFQLDSTSLCEICSACFHSGCFSPSRCPRCIRRESRRLSHDVLQEALQDAESFESSVEKGS